MTQDGEDIHELAERGDAYYHVLPQEAMPGHVKLTVKAGDVALFDTTTWVSAQDLVPTGPVPLTVGDHRLSL
eukprot:COSAG04_NODE_1998_length_5038_cov_2.280624_6_plen_72_part_00